MKFDVVVIGASTAGLRCAELLARRGVRVGLFERNGKEAPPRRTLIVTSALPELLGRDQVGEFEVHRIDRMTVKADCVQATIPLQNPDFIIERSRAIRALQRRAASAGVEIHEGCRLTAIETSGSRAQVILRRNGTEIRTLASEAVVGADGVHSPTGAVAGVSPPPSVPIVQAEVELPPEWNPGEARVWFSPLQTPFFFWVVPESEGRGVAGLAGNDRSAIRPTLERFLKRQGLEPEGYQASVVALHHPRLRPWGQVGGTPVLLVGDAAGQVKVTTVGGVVTGLAGAEAAARSILDRTPYARGLQSLRRELDAHWWIRRLLERLDRRGYARLIERLSGRTIRFLGRHNRDSVARAYWKLPLIEPGIAATLLRSLLSAALQARGNGTAEKDADSD